MIQTSLHRRMKLYWPSPVSQCERSITQKNNDVLPEAPVRGKTRSSQGASMIQRFTELHPTEHGKVMDEFSFSFSTRTSWEDDFR